MNQARLVNVGCVLCALGGALGVLGLIGWITATPFLYTFAPGEPPMMPNTGFCLALVGSSGAMRSREDARRGTRVISAIAALVVLAVGAGTLVEYAFGLELHLDRLLFTVTPGPVPGRMSPPTALSFALLGSALLLIDHRATARARPSEWLVILAALTAFTSLMGIMMGAGPLYRLPRTPVVGVALPTAISLLLTSLGLLLERPRAGLMGLATSGGPGSAQFRRLVLPTLAVPAALGVLITRVFHGLGVQQMPLVLGTLSTALTVVALVVLALTAVPLNRAYEALEASRARTQSLFEHAADGIFVADLSGRYTDVNPAGCRLLGVAREQIIGKTIVDLIPPEDIARLQASKELLLAGGVHTDEWTLRRGDGTYVPVEVSAKILPDGRWQGFVRDITERRRLEAAARRSEAKVSGIVAMSSDGIVSIDRDQRITLFNQGAENIFGYSRAEALGAPVDILFPERLRCIHRAHVQRFAAGREIARPMGERTSTIVGRRKNGEEFPADASISKLEMDGETILTVALRDVTERTRAQEQIRLTRERFELALQGADLAAWDWNVQTGEVVFNARWAEMRGYRPEEVRPHLDSWVSGVHPDDLPGVQEVLNAHFEGRIPEYVTEHRVRTKSGEYRWILDRGKVFARDAEGRPTRMVGTELDVTERRRTEEELRRSYAVAQEAVKTRDEVLGVVAHDLRNPLWTILMQAGLLKQRGDAVRRQAEMIERSATRMNRLIEDLLDVTRLDAGRLSVEHAPVPAREVLVDCVEAQRALAESASLDLCVDVEEDVLEVCGDRDRLHQVFENLIGNALKFTGPGGRITVGAAARGDEVLFWVADTGIGVAQEDVPHLFDRFWQARKPGHLGAGLGLAITKGIVEAHGGRIWVDSTPGRGITFFFTIPSVPRRGEWPPAPVQTH